MRPASGSSQPSRRHLPSNVSDKLNRCAARTVIDEIFRRVVTWFAPILCFTMEEAWVSRYGAEDSVHLQDFIATPAAWASPDLLERWKRLRELRRAITGALEIEREKKVIGSSLEELGRLSRTIDSLLFLARSENPAGSGCR